MAKITLPPITSLTNQESAILLLTEWKDRIEAALELTVSRNGQTPNTMNANLDLNSNRLLNLAAPVDDNDPVRLIDVVEGIRGEKGDKGDPGASVVDGDYGDVVISGSGSVYTLDPAVVTTVARTVLDDTTVAAMRTTLGLGDSATKNVGTSSADVASGTDTRWYAYTLTTQNTSFTFSQPTGPVIYKHTSATPHAFTINPVGSTAMEPGSQIMVYNAPGAGDITLTRGVGVSLYTNGSAVSADATLSAGGIATLIYLDSDTWICGGPGLA